MPLYLRFISQHFIVAFIRHEYNTPLDQNSTKTADYRDGKSNIALKSCVNNEFDFNRANQSR